MNKHSSKKIKNSTLVLIFLILVVCAIVISAIVKLGILIHESRFNNTDQFITEIKDKKNNEEIIAFNPTFHTINILQVKNVKQPGNIQSLQIPIDGQIAIPDLSANLSSILFSTIFHCRYPTCVHINAIDVLKLYIFARTIHQNAITSEAISLPATSTELNATIPNLFTDDKLYKEALSIAIVNASGQAGLANQLAKLLTNIGANVISITTGDTQQTTTMQSTYDTQSYTIQRLQQILGLTSHNVQNAGISDIVITIGVRHSQL